MARIIVLNPPPGPTDPLPAPAPPEIVAACPHDEAYYDYPGNLICAACFKVLEEAA